ncbi:MAG: quinolinate synthase NadA [Deltaproteobacteria bacterium]|nr:quinolinate synthase NadA [Deltaproteobacteria bacterium]
MTASGFGQTNEPFPSIVVRRNSLEPRGAYAESLATHLTPNAEKVAELKGLLAQKNIGVVAHFYMDPELQAVIAACDWPHIYIADSLVMAGRAVEMVKAGVRAIVVLGVDFMSENARALIDAAGFEEVPVYRVAHQRISCSLADAAASPDYHSYLEQAAETLNSLHVIYVNTGLDAKARAHCLLPTITCTSSNVVRLILQAAAQIPEVNIWFGPDTYMGENLYRLFASLLKTSEHQIRELHRTHTHESIQRLLNHYHYYKKGACIVHELFGQEVVERIGRDYPDALVAAHLEVPGETFGLALEAQRIGTGVVGSTSNILQFVSTVAKEAALVKGTSRLQLVLGTETGMITSVVRRIQTILRENAGRKSDVAIEIVFPVAPRAIAATSDSDLRTVPGVPGGEGCSLAGGCAVCPYMKMNSLDALFGLLKLIDRVDARELSRFEPRSYDQETNGSSVARIGGETILYMQAFQQTNSLPGELVRDVRSRNR